MCIAGKTFTLPPRTRNLVKLGIAWHGGFLGETEHRFYERGGRLKTVSRDLHPPTRAQVLKIFLCHAMLSHAKFRVHGALLAQAHGEGFDSGVPLAPH